MNAAYEDLVQHLNEREVRYLSDEQNGCIFADFRGEVGTYRIVAHIDSENCLFQVIGQAPMGVPQGSRLAIAETITRANNQLRVGKFEMDCDNGDMRFHTSQILSEDHLDDAVIGRLIGTTMAMMDMYLPAILSVIYSNELPMDAIRFVEAGRIC